MCHLRLPGENVERGQARLNRGEQEDGDEGHLWPWGEEFERAVTALEQLST